MDYSISSDIAQDPFFSKDALYLMSELGTYQPSVGSKAKGIINRNASFDKQLDHFKNLNYKLENYLDKNISEVKTKDDIEGLKGLMELRELISYLIIHPDRELYQQFANLHDDQLGPETYISGKDFAKAAELKQAENQGISSGRPIVVQLDDKVKDMKLQDKKISHAHLVSKSISDSGYVVEVNDVFNNYPLPISKHLEFVRKRAELGEENLQYVLIPIGLSYKDFKTLTQTVHINIKPGKAKEQAPLLHEAFKAKLKQYDKLKREPTEQEVANYITMTELVNVYDEVEKLSTLKKPITVVFAAGNEGKFGKDYVNLYALNPKALVIGALDEDGQVADYSAKTNLVDFFIEPTLPGTSFSAPRAISPSTISYFYRNKKQNA